MIKKGIALFTHNDLDGGGVEVVTKAHFENVTVFRCTPNDINETVKEFIESGSYVYHRLVIISDLSINGEIAEVINDNENLRQKFMIVDHHKSALFLNKYQFANIQVERNGVNASATSSLYSVLYNLGHNLLDGIDAIAMHHFCEKVRRYDTWDWFNIYKDDVANMLNSLFYRQGQDEFVESMIGKLKANIHYYSEGDWEGMFTKEELSQLRFDRENTEKYINSKLKTVKVYHNVHGKFAHVFAENHISELGNTIANEFEVDFVALTDLSKMKISLRSIGDFDVSAIAMKYGGGGHKNAGGFNTKGDLGDILSTIFETVSDKPMDSDDKTETEESEEWVKRDMPSTPYHKLPFFKKMKVLIDSFIR